MPIYSLSNDFDHTLTVCSAVSVSAAPTSGLPQQQTVQTSPSAYYTVHVGTNLLWAGWQYNYHQAYGFIEAGTGAKCGEIGLQRALDESGVAGVQ